MLLTVSLQAPTQKSIKNPCLEYQIIWCLLLEKKDTITHQYFSSRLASDLSLKIESISISI